MAKTIYTALLFLLAAIKVLPQSRQLPANTDNGSFYLMLTNNQERNLDSFYVEQAGIAKDFINGKDYRQNYYRSSGNPLLRAGRARTASLVYRTRKYTDITLQYDTFLDEVVYTDNSLVFDNIVHQVSLNSDDIPGFELYFERDTLVFRYFSEETEPGFNLSDGYYEVVYIGLCSYLVRHKSIHYKLHGVDEYSYIPEGFVRIDHDYIRVRGRKEFLQLFGDRTKEIRHFMSENKIRIKSASSYQVASVLRFYERTVDGEKP